MNEETARAGIRVREAEKAHNIRTFSHGRGAKKKDPNCILIRVLLWLRRSDTEKSDQIQRCALNKDISPATRGREATTRIRTDAARQ